MALLRCFCFASSQCRIIVLGFAFMFLFTAFQTCGMVETSVLNGVSKETNGTFKGDGYTSLATVYAVFAVANWAAPSIVSVLGPVSSMVIGAVCYLLFVLSFLKPMTATLYIASVLVGFGAAVIWTAQGNYLTINSDQTTITRHSGIFWALFQMSLFIGNLYVYFAFGNTTSITPTTRTTLFLVLSSVAGIGVILFVLLFCVRSQDNDFMRLSSSGENDDDDVQSSSILSDSSQVDEPNQPGAFQAFKRSLQLMVTKEMLLLSVTFAYTGFELTFFSGVYGTMAGNTKSFGSDAKSYIGLVGIFIGIGEVIGGAAFGIFGKRTIKYGRDPIVLLGFLVHMICFFLAFINFPEKSPLEETSELAYIQSNKYIAMVVGFLLGLGDSSYNTQIFSILGDVYKQDSAPAFALFKFIQSLAAAAGFFYSKYLLLQWQLLILITGNFLAVFAFFTVEWRTRVYSKD